MIELGKKNNINIETINLKSINDNKILNKDIVQKIYDHSEKEIVLITDNILKNNYIINIDKDIQPNKISQKDIEKYRTKANTSYVSNIYKSYDKFINTQYKIDINEKVLERLKNSF